MCQIWIIKLTFWVFPTILFCLKETKHFRSWMCFHHQIKPCTSQSRGGRWNKTSEQVPNYYIFLYKFNLSHAFSTKTRHIHNLRNHLRTLRSFKTSGTKYPLIWMSYCRKQCPQPRCFEALKKHYPVSGQWHHADICLITDCLEIWMPSCCRQAIQWYTCP